MLSSNLAKTTSSLLSANSTFLNRMIGVTSTQTRNMSVAFNVKSRFEAAFEARQTAQKAGAQPKKE